MLISSAYPTKYLKATDLQGKIVRVMISQVSMEDMGEGDQKPVVYFQGKEKGMVLNLTNANYISAYIGDETEAWVGHAIELYVAKVQFGRKMVDGLRVRMPATGQENPPAPPPPEPAQPQRQAPSDLDDEIPF